MVMALERGRQGRDLCLCFPNGQRLCKLSQIGKRIVAPGMLPRKQCCTNSSHRGEIAGYDERLGREFKNCHKCPSHASIGRNPALKTYGEFKAKSLSNGTLKISGYRKTEPGNNIIIRGRILLEVDHIAFCKYAASASNPRRMFGKGCKAAEPFDAEPEPAGLLIQK